MKNANDFKEAAKNLSRRRAAANDLEESATRFLLAPTASSDPLQAVDGFITDSISKLTQRAAHEIGCFLKEGKTEEAGKVLRAAREKLDVVDRDCSKIMLEAAVQAVVGNDDDKASLNNAQKLMPNVNKCVLQARVALDVCGTAIIEAAKGKNDTEMEAIIKENAELKSRISSLLRAKELKEENLRLKEELVKLSVDAINDKFSISGFE